VKLVLGMNPVSASRPRVSRWGTYYAEPYKSWKKRAAAEVRESLPPKHKPIDCVMKVTIHCAVPRPKTTKLPMPKPDVDNYAKAVLDACNKQVWTDDWLIRELTITKEWVDEVGWITLDIIEESA
jgi:Holliday junction resolvase RusA-like endonuclease